MVPGAVREWIAGWGSRHDPMTQVSATIDREAFVFSRGSFYRETIVDRLVLASILSIIPLWVRIHHVLLIVLH